MSLLRCLLSMLFMVAVLGCSGSVKFNKNLPASADNMRAVVRGINNYRLRTKSYPPGCLTDEQGEPTLSWRVAILPMMGYKELYERFNLNEPWDSETNLALLAEMPKEFRSPFSGESTGKTTYLAVGGPRGLINGKDRRSIIQVIDGTSNTILLVEVADSAAVEWTKPGDFEPSDSSPAQGLAIVTPDNKNLVALLDTSIQLVSADTPAETWTGLFTYDGREVIPEGVLPKEIQLLDPSNVRSAKARVDSAPSLKP